MATNYIQAGTNLTLTAPYDRLSGEAALIGSIFGVAQNDVLSGASGVFATEGVWSLPKVSTDVVALGATLYWNDTNKNFTVTSSGNTKVGVAVESAGNPSATVKVKLNGTV